MTKTLKRVSKTIISDGPQSKLPKHFDFKNLTKDISVLRTFNDFIEYDGFDVIDWYLVNHDFNDFLNYFSLHHLYKPDEFCLIYQVTSEILKRIADDLKMKHSLIGQAFSETFMNKYKSMLYMYLRNNKSSRRLMSCLRFITCLVLQSKDIALKVATETDFMKASLINLLKNRKLKEENDVHSSVVKLYASFFNMDSNHLYRKICEDNSLLTHILKDLRFDRFDNVQLIIEILHDKIVKNTTISKTLKMKIFNVSNLRFLLAVFDWKGAANSYDAFNTMTTMDENCLEIYTQLHALLIELCSSHRLGIVFVDNLLCLSQQGNINRKLFYILTSESMMDFFTNSYKLDLVMSILTACPDLVNQFVDHLVAIMLTRKPEFRSEILPYITQCYRLLGCDRINSILTEAWNYKKGEKFTDVALILCQPSKTLREFLQLEENIAIGCDDSVAGLRNAIFDICEKVFTWINVSNVIYSPSKKTELRQHLQENLLKNLSPLGWEYEMNILFTEEFLDQNLFAKPPAIEDATGKRDEEDESTEEIIDDEIRSTVDELQKLDIADSENGKDLLKKICQHFIGATEKSIWLLKLIGESMLKKQISLKKKYRRLLIEALTTDEYFSEHWSLLLHQDELYGNSELKRNCVLDIIIHFVSQSQTLKNFFFERVHPLKLISVYGASLSHSDQKIFHLFTLGSRVCSEYNFSLFGTVVLEHYMFQNGRQPNLHRPIVNSQCLNLIEDEKMNGTIKYFPLCRPCSVANDNSQLELVPSQSDIYDPLFLLKWISQLIFNISDEGDEDNDKKLKLVSGIDMKTLFTKQIFSFLIACQTSENRYIRLESRLYLQSLLSILRETLVKEDEDFPLNIKVDFLISHLLASTSVPDDGNPLHCVKLSSVFANYYIRMLKLVESQGKKLFMPLFDIFTNDLKFDLRYVPGFQKLMYSKDIDARLCQGWCLGLLADSVKSVEDFRVVLNSHVLTHVLSTYGNWEQNTKKIILTLIKRCVAIEKVAPMLYKFPQFVMWLQCVTNSNEEIINRPVLVTIIQLFIETLKKSGGKKINIDELERSFGLHRFVQ